MAKSVLKRTDLEKAQIIKVRLSEDYLPFFENLDKAYPFTDDNKKLIQKTIADIKMGIRLIARVFQGRGLTPTGVQEFVRLTETLDEIEKSKSELLAFTAISQHLSIAVDSVETGISPEEMSLSVELVKAEKKVKEKKAAEPKANRGYGSLGFVGALAQSAGLSSKAIVGGGILSQILAPLLGPMLLAPVIGLAGLKLGAYGARKAYGGGKWLQNLISGRAGSSAEGSDLLGSASSILPDIGGGAAMQMPGPAPAIGPGRTPFRLLSRRSKEATTEPLFYFFNKRAYRAKWTKELLQAVKGKSKGTSGSSGGVLGFLGGLTVAGLAKAIIPLIGPVALIVGGFFLGNYIKLMSDQAVQSVVNVFGKGVKSVGGWFKDTWAGKIIKKHGRQGAGGPLFNVSPPSTATVGGRKSLPRSSLSVFDILADSIYGEPSTELNLPSSTPSMYNLITAPPANIEIQEALKQTGPSSIEFGPGLNKDVVDELKKQTNLLEKQVDKKPSDVVTMPSIGSPRYDSSSDAFLNYMNTLGQAPSLFDY